MKKVYLVHGSEDGILGVFSNIKRAYARAVEYATYENPREVLSYAKTCKFLNTNGYAYVVEGSYATSQIEVFYLNS